MSLIYVQYCTRSRMSDMQQQKLETQLVLRSIQLFTIRSLTLMVIITQFFPHLNLLHSASQGRYILTIVSAI